MAHPNGIRNRFYLVTCFLAVIADPYQEEGSGEDQSEVHRHFQQIRSWSLPDSRGEANLHGKAFSSFVFKCPARDVCLHMGGILAVGSAGSASLPTYSVFTSGWNFFKLGTYIK